MPRFISANLSPGPSGSSLSSGPTMTATPQFGAVSGGTSGQSRFRTQLGAGPLPQMSQPPQPNPLFEPFNTTRMLAGVGSQGLNLLSRFNPELGPSLTPAAGGFQALGGVANIGTALTAPGASNVQRALGVTQGALQAGQAGARFVGAGPATTSGLGAGAGLAGLGLSAYDLTTRGAQGIPGLILSAPSTVAAGAQLAGQLGLTGASTAAGAAGATGAGAAGAAGAGTAAGTGAGAAAAGGAGTGVAGAASTLSLAMLPLAAISLVGSLVAANEAKKKFKKVSGGIDEARVAMQDIASAFQTKPLPEALKQPVSIGGNPSVGGLLRAAAEMNLQGKFAPAHLGGAIGLPRHGKSRNPDLFAPPNPKYGPVVSLLDQMGIKPETNVEWGTLFSYGGSQPVFSALDALAEQASRVPGLGVGPQALTPEQYAQNIIQQDIQRAGSLPAFASTYWSNPFLPKEPGERAWMPEFLRTPIEAALARQGLGSPEAARAAHSLLRHGPPPEPGAVWSDAREEWMVPAPGGDGYIPYFRGSTAS